MRINLHIIMFSVLTISLSACGESGSGEEEMIDESVETCDCNELLFDQNYNNFYMTVPREGYTGACETYYANGQLHQIKHFTKGKVDGELRTYYENGQLDEEKFFEMNFQQDDFRKYDEDGTLLFHVKFERGQQVETVYVDTTTY